MWLLCVACLLPMIVAVMVLDTGRGSAVRGVIDDAASCVAAGAVYLEDGDECAFTGDVAVEAGEVLVLDAGVAAFSFRRGLDVEGTLVADSEVTTPDDAALAGTVRVRGSGSVRATSAVRAD